MIKLYILFPDSLQLFRGIELIVHIAISAVILT